MWQLSERRSDSLFFHLPAGVHPQPAWKVIPADGLPASDTAEDRRHRRVKTDCLSPAQIKKYPDAYFLFYSAEEYIYQIHRISGSTVCLDIHCNQDGPILLPFH